MSRHVQVIAEAGVNHNGSLELAKRLIEAAADAGADAVKFQTFKAERLVTRFADKAEYQKKRTGDRESQFEMLRKLELSESGHEELIRHCRKRQIEFLSTPFDEASLDLLVGKFGLRKIKISSGDLTNLPLLLKAASLDCRVFLSTGMATLGEIEAALGALAFGYLGWREKPSLRAFLRAYGSAEAQAKLKENVILLHCTTEYPAPYPDVHLNKMVTLARAFDLPVGYSDHTLGTEVAVAAVALGACVIEKHFTLDKTMEGPDHRASLEPDELAGMIRQIRNVEQALGSGRKSPVPSEEKNMDVARKSIVAARDIREGETFDETNLTIKRPGSGLPPSMYWDLLGRTARRSYQKDELIEW